MSVEFWISTTKMTRNDFHFRFVLRFFFRFYFRFHFRPENEPEVEKSSKMIKDDVEIQNWIGEVKRHGFTYADDAEIPQVHGWHVFVNIFGQHFFTSISKVTQICWLIDIQTLNWWRTEILNQNLTGDLTVMSSLNVNHRSTVNWLAWSNWIIVDFNYFCLFCSARRYFQRINPIQLKDQNGVLAQESWSMDH